MEDKTVSLVGVTLQAVSYAKQQIQLAENTNKPVLKKIRLSRAKGALKAIASFGSDNHYFQETMAKIDALWPKSEHKHSSGYGGYSTDLYDDDLYNSGMPGDPADYGDW